MPQTREFLDTGTDKCDRRGRSTWSTRVRRSLTKDRPPLSRAVPMKRRSDRRDWKRAS